MIEHQTDKGSEGALTIKEFVETLRPMLKNPTAIDTYNGVICLYTPKGEFIAFDIAIVDYANGPQFANHKQGEIND